MIVRCPSCSSRRDIPDLPQGRGAAVVDCPDCGHDWIEGMALPALTGTRTSPALAAPGQLDPASLVEAALDAKREFGVRRRTRRRRLLAWAGLAAVTLAPLAGAAALPEHVVAAIPITIRAYDWIGQDVNIYGLEIRHIDLQHLIVDGRKVIAIKGELVNVSSTVRKIPWLRFGLRSSEGSEVYHWTLDTEVRPLKPGESTSFVTRLASPPEAARNLEIRFARADEIGSNKAP